MKSHLYRKLDGKIMAMQLRTANATMRLPRLSVIKVIEIDKRSLESTVISTGSVAALDERASWL